MCTHGLGRIGCNTSGINGEGFGEFGYVFSSSLDVCADGLQPCCLEDVCGGRSDPGTVW